RPGGGHPGGRGHPASARAGDQEGRAPEQALPAARALPRLQVEGRTPPGRGDGVLPQRLLPRAGVREHRPLRVAPGDGHPRARPFGTMKALAKASVEQINEIRGIGPAIAEAVAGFFAEPKNRKLVERLEKLGLNMKEPVVAEGKGPLAGHLYVITGTLPSLSRAKAAELIEAAGGHVSDAVSKKTTAVVVGADAGSKLEKAKTLRIPLIDEAELLRRARAKPQGG